MPVNNSNLDNVMTYHAPSAEDIAKYAAIREAAKTLIKVILDSTVISGDQQAAIRHVREAVMTANASVATDGAV